MTESAPKRIAADVPQLILDNINKVDFSALDDTRLQMLSSALDQFIRSVVPLKPQFQHEKMQAPIHLRPLVHKFMGA